MYSQTRVLIPPPNSSVLSVLAVLSVLSFLLLPTPAHAVIDHAAFPTARLVVSPNASPSEHHAADEFAHYWQATTGHAPARGPGDPSDTHIWIGHDALPPELAAELPIDGFGDEGLYIKTLRWNGHDHLAIVGGHQRGTLYGVYEFFERYMGVRWLAPDETYIPDAPNRIRRIDYRFVPPAFYRDISQRTFMTNPAFAAIHRMNGRFVNSQRIGGSGPMPDRLGGKIDYTNGFAGWGHTFFTFIHPDAYFETHPEYFSEIGGERQRHPTQLCLTNPDVIRIVTDKAKAMLRAEPQARIVSVSQMDWEYYCRCSACRAIDEREGTPAGAILNFVNQVAEGIEDEFPDSFIDTYAYMYSQTPPKTLRARDNVIVRLCTFNNDFSKRVNARGSARNRRFTEDLEGWARVAKNLFIYDYLPNFNAFQQPNPNLHTIQPNYRYFTKHRVTGLYAQGNPESPASEFEHLRAYVAAKAMWDPDIDAGAVMHEFIGLYYGEAAPHILRYIDLITDAAKRAGKPLTLFASLDWMDYDTVVRADELFRVAFMNMPEGKYHDRLREAYLPVRHAALVCKPRVTWSHDRVTLERPPSLTLDEYWNLLRYHGVTHLNDYPIETWREELPITPPRRLEATIHRLENDAYEAWIAPELSGSLIRLRDKRQRIDWFAAYDNMAAQRDDFRDLMLQDGQLVVGNNLAPAHFEVLSAEDARLELRAEANGGLVVKKTFTLRKNALEIVTEVESSASEPVKIQVNSRPETRLHDTAHPDLLTLQNGEWHLRDDMQTFADGKIRVGMWDATAINAWILDENGKKLRADCSGPRENLHLRSAQEPQRATLGLISPEITLQPNQTESWTTTLTTNAPYASSRRHG